MTDYCTKTPTEADFNAVMLAAGLIDEEGNPASYTVLIDRIGSITMQTGVDDNGDPVTVTYPEYYTNVRLLFDPTEEQDAALKAISIDPSAPQYRVWA